MGTGQTIWNMPRAEYERLCGQQAAAAQNQLNHDAYYAYLSQLQAQQNPYMPPDWNYMTPDPTPDDGATIDGECVEVAPTLLLEAE